MVTVPDVVGLDQTTGQSDIISASLTVGTVSLSFSNTVAAGDIISQTPTGGTSAPIGSGVDIEVSLGIRGDLDVSGTVDIVDVRIMASEWGTTGTIADIEPIGGDSKVDLRDFAILALNWQRSI